MHAGEGVSSVSGVKVLVQLVAVWISCPVR